MLGFFIPHFCIGNGEVNRCRPVIRGHLHFGRNRDLAVRSVNVEHAVNFHGRFSLARNCAVDSVGTKRNLGIARALQNFLVHLAVAHPAAAIAARGVDHNLARDFSRCRLELKRSVLQLESSVHGVENIAQCELDRSLRRIKLERRVLRRTQKWCTHARSEKPTSPYFVGERF